MSIEGTRVVEEIKEPFEYGFILPVSIGFFWRFDPLQVLLDGHREICDQMTLIAIQKLRDDAPPWHLLVLRAGPDRCSQTTASSTRPSQPEGRARS